MASVLKTIHIGEVPIEKMEKREGWAISEFRLPITKACGSATTVFHSIFRPGSTHAKHLHENCEEIAFYQKGIGVVGQGESRAEVRAGHCRLMPKGSQHFFFNETEAEDALVVGFYIGAGDVADSGYRFCGNVTEADLVSPRSGLSGGILVNLSETEQLDTLQYDAWSGTELRMPIGRHNGSTNALIHIRIPPSGGVKSYCFTECEQIFYLIQGKGVASSNSRQFKLRTGHFIYVPKAVSLALVNSDPVESMDVLGLLTGAGSLQEGGYVASNA